MCPRWQKRDMVMLSTHFVRFFFFLVFFCWFQHFIVSLGLLHYFAAPRKLRGTPRGRLDVPWGVWMFRGSWGGGVRGCSAYFRSSPRADPRFKSLVHASTSHVARTVRAEGSIHNVTLSTSLPRTAGKCRPSAPMQPHASFRRATPRGLEIFILTSNQILEWAI